MKKTATKTKSHLVNKHEDILKMIDPTHFRVAIFGSARIQNGDKVYKQVYEFAKKMGEKGIDLVTGGGSGLMEAANRGHEHGDKNNLAQSIGLTIQLNTEARNSYLELEKHFDKFSNRLDTFVSISHAVVIMPGGVGTCLEFFYVWQLIQVQHIYQIPIIMVGDQWKYLIDWIKKYPLKQKLLDKKDLENIYVAKTNKEALDIIKKTQQSYKFIGNDKLVLNMIKYGKNNGK